MENADPGRLRRPLERGPRQEAARGLELVLEPLHVVDVGQAFLGIAREAVAAGAAGEIGAERRMRAGQGAVGDAVAVDIVVASEIRDLFQSLERENLSPVVDLGVIPLERRAQV